MRGPGTSTAATPAPRAGGQSSPGRRIDTHGVLRTFTIVAYAAPGIPVPFVAGVVDCGGTSVRANLINVEPDPEHVTLGYEGPAGHLHGRDGRRGDRGRRLRLRATLNRRRGAAAMSLVTTSGSSGSTMTKFGKHPDKDMVDLAAEAVARRAGRRRRHHEGHRRHGGREPHGRRRDRPAAAKAGRPDRHPRLQRGQRLRHRGDGPAHRHHGGQGGRVRHGPGGRGREAVRRRAAGGGGRADDGDRLGAARPLRRGDPDRRADRHRDHARRVRPDRPGVRPPLRRRPASSCSPASRRRTMPTRRSTRWPPTQSG